VEVAQRTPHAERHMTLHLSQTYTSIYAFQRAHGITWPATEAWRLTERVLGEIVGLPGSRGILTATNGILCYIEQESFGRVETYLGHIQWFLPDGAKEPVDVEALVRQPKKPSSRQAKLEAALGTYE
jgi:hypothetical protein